MGNTVFSYILITILLTLIISILIHGFIWALIKSNYILIIYFFIPIIIQIII